jgi:hypothetical protein
VKSSPSRSQAALIDKVVLNKPTDKPNNPDNPRGLSRLSTELANCESRHDAHAVAAYDSYEPGNPERDHESPARPGHDSPDGEHYHQSQIEGVVQEASGSGLCDAIGAAPDSFAPRNGFEPLNGQVEEGGLQTTSERENRRPQPRRELELYQNKQRIFQFRETKSPHKMDDLTQGSTLSPTQENDISAYNNFRSDLILQCRTGEENITSSNQLQLNAIVQESQVKHSVGAESTGHTYGENDTGHVAFDTFEIDEPDLEDASQDASLPPPVKATYEQQSYEPETPAPPVNPFGRGQGTLMKPHEMFGATQPSSIARHMMPSATSSRPSPNIYDDFTSPIKRIPSSPLAHRAEEHMETSPLQVSVREILRSSQPFSNTNPRNPGIQSFKALPHLRPHEPRPYTSMRASQERRKASSSPVESETDDDMDLGDELVTMRQQLQDRRAKILQELSSVQLSRPSSSGNVDVEVPSTGHKGRRRSIEDDYVAQCEGLDARDSQNEDVIADSQALPAQETSVPSPDHVSSTASTQSGCHVGELRSESHCEIFSEAPQHPETPFQQPSLPLQELSGNRNSPRTSSRIPFSDTIPETSPHRSSPPQTADRIRPMSEIASLSLDESQGIIDAPGFTQDEIFNDLTRSVSLDPSPVKSRRQRRTDPSSSRNDEDCVKAASGFRKATEIESIRPEFGSDPNNTTKASSSKLPAKAVGLQSEQLEDKSCHPANNLQNDLEKTPQAKSSKARTKRGVLRSAEKPSHPDANLPFPDNESNGEKIHGANPIIPTNRSGLRSENVTPSDDISSGTENHRVKVGSEKAPKVAVPKNSAKNAVKGAKNVEGTPAASKRSEGKVLKTYAKPRRQVRRAKASFETATPSRRSESITSSALTTPGSTPELSTPLFTPPEYLADDQVSVSSGSTLGPTPARVDTEGPILLPTSGKKSKRKSTQAKEEIVPTRSSKRQSTVTKDRDSSADPLAGPVLMNIGKRETGLFNNMAFAVSCEEGQVKKEVKQQIVKEGGQLLPDGFDMLFNSSQTGPLKLSTKASNLGFTALIADEHSRKIKWMQALALDIPCISARWVEACVQNRVVVDWKPYLLSAGHTDLVGKNATHSRSLPTYVATDVRLSEIVKNRKIILDGRSIVLVTGKKLSDKKKAYIFLTRALGPARLELVTDDMQARQLLLDSDGKQEWDIVYVDGSEKSAASTIFGQEAKGSKKRKREGPEEVTPAPKRVRIISDETITKSLIVGALLD